MQPLNPHGRFFSSLEQVEKRLSSETPPPKPPHPPPPTVRISSPSSEPFGSPLYLEHPVPFPGRRPCHLQDSSGPPSEFLSSPQIPPQQHGPPDNAQINDIDRLVDLLGLSTAAIDGGGGGGGGSTCDCSGGGGFYSRVAGVKGPKCDREMRRLDGWIEHYRGLGAGGRREPARLAHLLLAKATCSAGGGDSEEGESSFREIGFPVTVEEYLQYDPPPLPH